MDCGRHDLETTQSTNYLPNTLFTLASVRRVRYRKSQLVILRPHAARYWLTYSPWGCSGGLSMQPMHRPPAILSVNLSRQIAG